MQNKFEKPLRRMKAELQVIQENKKQARNAKAIVALAIPRLQFHLTNINALLVDKDEDTFDTMTVEEDREVVKACQELARYCRRLVEQMGDVADARTAHSISYGRIIFGLQDIEKQVDNIVTHFTIVKRTV
jgi:hypothetical protein